MRIFSFMSDDETEREMLLAMVNHGKTASQILREATKIYLEKLYKDHEKRTGKPYVVPAHLQEN